MTAQARPTPEAFRPDLEGLRGLAILLVLAFHAGVPGIDGGFVGVDVFFVLSGFLITGLLLRERALTGRVNLAAFYARRARRILPAAAAVIVATLAFSAVVLDPLDLIRVAGDAIASALSAGNMRFAAGATDYFATGQRPSPLLHYWSLGVEEQFYLVWPALLIVATRLRPGRTGAGLTLALVLVASWVGAWWLTDVSAPWAFYSLPTRAWQLALGGLLAVMSFRLDRTPGRLVTPAGWLGLAAIGASAVVINSGTPYPGVAALLPCLGTAGVIVAGARPWGPGALLRLPPMRFLGRISYSLYLVHWPILVLPAASLALGEELPLEARLGLAVVSIAVGWACFRLVEQPFHRGRRFAASPGRTLAIAGAAIAITVLVGAGVSLNGSQILDAADSARVGDAGNAPGASATPALVAGGGPTATPTAAPATPPLPATPPATLAPASGAPSGPPASVAPPPSASPMPAPSPSPTPRPTAPPMPIRPAAGPQPLPRGVQPPLKRAADDWERLLRDGCVLQEPAVNPTDCVYGDPKGAVTVALVGDSHASQWFPALERIALDQGWRLLPFVKFSCRFTDLPIYSRILKREYTECEKWRLLVVERLQAIKPDLVIVSAAIGFAPINPADVDPVRQGSGMARLLRQIPGRIAVLADTPASKFDVPACISGHLQDVTPCQTSRAAALTWSHLILEQTAVEESGAALVDMTDRVCPWDPCPVLLGGMIVYRDAFHMTATFAASLAPSLLAALPPFDLPPSAAGAPGIPSRLGGRWRPVAAARQSGAAPPLTEVPLVGIRLLG